MNINSIGFIGGGRITGIFLTILKNNNILPKKIIVSDINSNLLENLKSKFPSIEITENNSLPAECELVFISLHPPVFIDVLTAVSGSINKNSTVISLAPKISIAKMQSLLPEVKNIGRMIPNAPSIIGEGFNPIVFSDDFDSTKKEELMVMFNYFGKTPIVKEYDLEAFAILTAMGPTYLWFQLNELIKLGASFGVDNQILKEGIKEMVSGAVNTLLDSNLNYEEVIDLVPVKPLSPYEESIKCQYNDTLTSLFEKLKK